MIETQTRIKLCSLHTGPQGSCCSLSPQGWTGLQLSFAFVLVRPSPGTHWGRGRHGTVSSPCTPWDQLLTCHSWICSVPPPPLHCSDKQAQMLLGSLKTGTAHRSLYLPQPHWGIFTFSDSLGISVTCPFPLIKLQGKGVAGFQ